MSDIGNREIFARNLKYYMEITGKSRNDICEALGFKYSTFTDWVNGNKYPRIDRIEMLANYFGIEKSDLIEDRSNTVPRKMPSNILPMPSFVKVPRVGQIACGTPILAEQNIEDYDSIPDYIHCDFTLVCKGDSMINARIFDGDIVCIKIQPAVNSGEIAAVMVGEDEATLKRVKLFDDHIVLEPENPMYKPLTFWGEEMNNVHIIGKATHFISAVR